MAPEIRREIEALKCILTPSEFEELLLLPFDYKRRLWIDEYWSLKDPIFTTTENEIRIEHKRRVDHAKSEFFISEWPMWDQRGEVYIRYGPPSFRRIIPGEVSADGISPPGELWYYQQHNMYVLFEDNLSNGRFTYYMERVKGSPSLRMKNISDGIDAPTTNTIEIPRPLIAEVSAYEKFQKGLGKFFELCRTKPATYSYEFEENQQYFVFCVDNFRGGESIDRVDVNIEFLADQRPIEFGKKTNEYVATAVFWDMYREEAGRREQRIEIPVLEEAQELTQLIPAQLIFSLTPGFYHMAVTVEERNSGRISSSRTDIVCRDFESKLAMSDILFASKITPVTRTSPFNRGALKVIPHASRRYSKSHPIQVYFEVYNLDINDQGISSYAVEYWIVSREPTQLSFWNPGRKKEASLVFSSSFKNSCHGPHDVIHFTVDTDNLWEGIFAFEVKITDNSSFAVTSQEADFRIID